MVSLIVLRNFEQFGAKISSNEFTGARYRGVTCVVLSNKNPTCSANNSFPTLTRGIWNKRL